MLKITLVIQEKTDSDDCTVKLEKPKNLEKASQNERNVGGAVFNAVEKALKELQK